MAQLSADTASLNWQLRRFGENLAVLQHQLAGAPVVSAAAPPMYRPPAPTHPPVPMAPPMASAPRVAPPPAGAPPRTGPPGPGRMPAPARSPLPTPTPWWQREGAVSKVLAAAGGVVTLIGVVMMLVLAAQSGFFGPVPRVVGGAVLSFVLVAAGIRVHARPGGRYGAIALATTGFAGLYFDIMAVSVVYEWIPVPLALAVALVVAGAGVALAAHWDVQALAVALIGAIAILGAVVTDGVTLTLVAFLLVVQLAPFPAQWYRRWRSLSVVRTVPVVLALIAVVVSTGGYPDADAWWALGAAAAVALLGLASAVTLTARDPEDVGSSVACALAAVPILAVGTAFPPLGGAVIALVTAVVLFTVVAFATRIPGALQTVVAGVATVALLEVCLFVGGGSLSAVLLLGNAAVFLELARQVRSRLVLGSGLVFLAAGGLAYAVTVPPEALVESREAIDVLGAGAVAASVALAISAFLAVRGARSLGLVGDDSVGVLYAVAGGAALYGATATAVTIGTSVSPTSTGFVAGHCAATILWMLTATGSIVFGLHTPAHRRTAIGAGLVLAGAALVKLFFFDLATLDGMFRVAAFLVAGLLLLFAAAHFGRRMSTPGDSGSPPGSAA
ncbi:DUF2339 domain-containing protein [Rhodococcus triatomae]|uniref:DUF2339 domain-containing protein n=1 Tax=Rhodococcus triatomae TaxID=300028 RepID=UPI0011136FD3|nr:DUF2339 domain-containing protein [Rhodococcus triatomae]QNG20320.1 DUF2339 domain-containing protein [Rhodococcus triatomae]QNG23764.1 DUF2339 domain-containing protein [Rhodococcus triatomae]